MLDKHWTARQVFDPILAWARERFGADFAVDDSIFGAHQSKEAVAALRRYLESAARGPRLGCHALPCLAEGGLPITSMCDRMEVVHTLHLSVGDEHAVWMQEAGCSRSRLEYSTYALSVELNNRCPE